MWIKLYGGQLKPNIKYSVIPQEEFDALKASHGKLVGVIQGALRIEDLWLINEPVNDQHIGEAEALARMKHEFDQALKDAEKIK